MRRECLGDAVGLPDIHLGAAGAVEAKTRIAVRSRIVPFEQIGLSVDKLEVVRTLRVTVAGAVRSTGLVAGVFGHTAITIHFDKVKGTVQPAWQGGDIGCHGEFSVLQLELHVPIAGNFIENMRMSA